MSKELENKYIDKMKEHFNKYGDYDQEMTHVVFDGMILDLLEELGYEELVKVYNDVKEEITFWYA